MRFLFAGLAVFAAACAEDVTVAGGDAAAPAEGYTLELRATQGEQTYLITAPDGRVVGARAAEGASALMDAERARAFAADPPPPGQTPPEVMSMRLPGFELQINAEEGDANDENGRVALSIGADGQNVTVNADEGGPGDADDRAYIRITGADEATVRDFIDDAEELSAEVKAEMLAELDIRAAAATAATP
jgi:hypothetical protein